MLFRCIASAMAGLAFASVAAFAQTAPPQGTAPIAGADVMSDKNRSGPDGWVQAPVTRTESPSGSSPSEQSGKDQHSDATLTAPAPYSSRPMPPGQDPGTPLAATPSGPGSRDVPQSQR